MTLADTLSAALWGARSRPARTGALLLALASGVAAVVFVGAVVAGFGQEIERLTFGAYSRALVIRENGLVEDRHGPPTLADQSALAAELPQVETSAAWRTGRAVTRAGGEVLSFSVFGVNGDYRPELDTPLAQGRWITPEEAGGYARVCLLGLEAAEKLGEAAQVGRVLLLNGVNCEVVGVLGEPRSRPGNRFLLGVVTPFRAAERYFLDDDILAPGAAQWLTVILEPGADRKAAEMRADLLLRNRRGAPLSSPSPFAYGDDSNSAKELQDQRRLIGRLLGAVAALTLAASLTAFAGIAAAALSARRREIALRMAMGASARDILGQILMEYGLVGCVGGLLGLVGGLGLGGGTAAVWGWPFSANLGLGLLAIVMGVGVGLLVGGVLAGRAAQVPPSLAAREG